MEYSLLGAVEVRDSGETIPLRGKQRALLAMLLVHAGEPVSSDRLIDALWGEHPPASAANSVQVYVSQLRKALGDGRVVTWPAGYALQLGDDELDTRRFERLVAEGRACIANGETAEGSRGIAEALALWRGPPLADFAREAFARTEIARLEEARLGALEDRIAADLSLGAAAELVPELEALVRDHPLRERARAQLMLALYRSGRQADALTIYREGRTILVRELGLEPGPELQALEQAVLRHDPELRLATPEATSRAGIPRALILAGAAGLLLAAAVGAGILELTKGGAGIAAVPPNSIAAIDPGTNKVMAEAPVGTRPGPLAYGDGSLWIGNRDDDTVSRVSPASLGLQRTIEVGTEPTGIAASARSVWVVGADPSAPAIAVRRIDPRFDDVTSTPRVNNVVAGGPAAVVASRGALWVAPSSGLLTRLDPATGQALFHVDPNTSPTGVTAGYGALWLPNADADTVTRVDPTGLRTSIPVGRGPAAAAAGGGAVWVVDALDDALIRIDPATQAIVDTIPVGRAPSSVLVAFGSVWVANSRDGTVSRVDPRTRAVATIRVGGSPQGLLAASGRVWVTVDTPFPATPPEGGVARIESLADVLGMDPALVWDPRAWQLLDATCAKLMNYPDRPAPAGAELEPEVATSLPQVSPDGRTYAFKIRPGFRFSTGEPVTARTFAYSIERTLDPRMHSPGVVYFRDVVGANAYMQGRATHIAGLRVHGDSLTIRLVAPAPDLPTRLALPFFCAVPLGTPIDPQGVRELPSAGPYYVASYTPGQGVVLDRNPYYRGNRPHRLRQIVFTPGIAPSQQMRDVATGQADYAANVPPADYFSTGARRAAATTSTRRLSVNVFPQLDLLALNTDRPLFADVRMRRAVNYAIDRTALTRLGDPFSQIPGRPTDQYLPPDVPGYHDAQIYPFRPDVAKAKALTGGRTDTAVLYTCDQPPCDRMAQLITTDLAAIGIRVETKTFGMNELFTREARKGEPFDIAWGGWVGDYPDPDEWLNVLLESGAAAPAFDDPVWRRRLERAARLSGPERYLAYGRLDAELARDAAPWVPYANRPTVAYLSPRLGCRVYQPVYGFDLAALCIRDSG